MSEEELTKLETALKSKDENTITEISISHSNAERVKLREDYKSKFNRELLEDIQKNMKGDLCTLLISIYRDPVEYDAELLYRAMKGIGTDDDILIEVICFRSTERLNQIKEKFKESYGKELVKEVESECSGEYKNTLKALLESERSQNKNPDLENCKNIAEELYKAGEGKLGTNDTVFVKYFTTLSPEELMLVGKEYHKSHKKNLVEVIESEMSGELNKVLKCILYGLISPSEYFARQISVAVKGVGTNDTQLIRSVVSRADEDMKMIKRYYKKLFNKDMAEEVKADTSGNYQKILLHLIGAN